MGNRIIKQARDARPDFSVGDHTTSQKYRNKSAQKPDSFYHMKLPYVKKLHEKLDYPVYDLVYDGNGEWTNYLSVISNFL